MAHKKTRDDLRDLFKTGAKPSGDDFSDFIESVLNVLDDGIEKQSGDDGPLRITARGPEENLLDFGVDQSAYTWRINQKSDEGESGFNLSSNTSGSKLFIESATGNVGIGTSEPGEKLEVNGRIKLGALTIGSWPKDSGYVFFGTNALDQAQAANYALLQDSSSSGGGTGRTFLNSPVDIRFRIGSTEKMILANNGNVGIGTLEPGEKLEVNGPIKSGALTIGPWPVNSNYVFFGTNALDQAQDSNYALLQDSSSSGTGKGRTFLNSPVDIRFRIGSTEKMILANNGNVGIGTTQPRDPLTIRAQGEEEGLISFEDPSGQTKWHIEQNHGGNTPGLNFAETNVSDFRLFIAAGGNVGIGTSEPGEKLEVNGRIKLGALTIGSWPINSGYVFFGTNALDQAQAANYALLQDSSSSGGGKGRTFLNSPVDIRFRIEGEEKMILAQNGNVGIGTTEPTAKLHVVGELLGAAKDHEGEACRIAVGTTDPDATNWVRYNANTVYVDVDTSSAQFSSTPFYFTSLSGNSGYFNTYGATSIYSPSANKFRVYVKRDNGVTADQAKSWKWRIKWIGIGN